ncbi:MAG: hypothetical protein CMP55_01735 [Flavobacteriales bacterium]|nr:hypothetical protein [Flavobacteriales bacterium]|tara:strand:- start:1975 stop:3162 length:1188 start_codon:yes stop_codon:yes gene_type:complete
MKYILFFKLFLFSTILFSQCDGRYESEIFNEVNKTIVEYTDVYDWSVFDSGLDMDIYQPSNDTTTNRPLLIFAHGGTYVAGNKNNPTMVSLCESFAKRGYVTASIQYRLTSALNLLLPNAYDIFSQTVLNAVSDMKAAVRFFRKDFFENGNTYGINPNQIFVGGNSAGAVTAAHLTVIDENQIPSEFQSYFDLAGGMEGNSGNFGYSSEVNGAILLAGAINSVDFIDVDDKPIVSLHAIDDNTIFYNCENAIGNSSLPILCGAGEIHNKLNDIGIINDLFTFQSGGHSAPMVNIDNIVIPFISDFLHQLICNTSSVEDIYNSSLKAFPNPVKNYLFIESDKPVYNIVITDLLGNKLLDMSSNSPINQINTSFLKNGIYFLFNKNDLSSHKLILKK